MDGMNIKKDDVWKAVGGAAIVTLLLFLCGLAAAAPARATEGARVIGVCKEGPDWYKYEWDRVTGQQYYRGWVSKDEAKTWPTMCAYKPTDPVVTETYSWRLPNGGTQQNVTWPQSLVGKGIITPTECGVTYQVDTYRGTRAQIDAVVSDGVLVSPAEDSPIYVSHQWTYGGVCPPEPQERTRVEAAQWQADTMNCTENVWTRTRDVFTITERSADGGETWNETARTNAPVWETVREATAQECGIRPDVPTLPEPTYTQWVDGTWGCDDTTVTQTRTRVDFTQPPFDTVSWTWPSAVPSEPVTETQARDLTEGEMSVCPIPPAPTPTPTQPSTEPTPTPGPAHSPDPTISAPSSQPSEIGSVLPSASPQQKLNVPSDNSSTPSPTRSELAYTGTSPLLWALGALALIGGGAWLIWRTRNA